MMNLRKGEQEDAVTQPEKEEHFRGKCASSCMGLGRGKRKDPCRRAKASLVGKEGASATHSKAND